MAARQTGTAPPGQTRVGVVDIGSNSLRLVVYDRLSRSLLPVFNEKVMCGLGRGLGGSGRLNAEGVALALDNLGRFLTLADGMRLERLDLLATAAVREAEDGEDFVGEIRRRFGREVRVLTGGEEARLSALGVVSDMPGADGAMGDLGGGSLELVSLEKGRPGANVTLPLGPLRLVDASGGNLDKAAAQVDEALASVPWLPGLAGRSFFPVGGAWRAIARIHMAQVGYPLRVVDQYSVKRARLESVIDLLRHMSRRSLEKLEGVPRRRLDTLPFAALVLDRLLAAGQPRRVTFSAQGLREGFLFDRLPEAVRDESPLVDLARQVAARASRCAVLGDELFGWSAPLFATETGRQARVRLAACLLSDVGWADHPDYRAEQAFLRLQRLSVLPVRHGERAFLALAVHARYGGGADDPATAPLRTLLDEADQRRARALGLALRLGYTLCGAAPGVLGGMMLAFDESRLNLHVPDAKAHLLGEVVERRLQALAAELARRPGYVIGEGGRALRA